MNRLILFIFLSAFNFLSHAQNFQKIDSLSKELIKKYSLKGIGMVGVQGDKIVYENAFGKANEKRAFDDSTKIYIASNTKAFIGLAMNKLAHANKLDLEAPITDYISKSYFPSNLSVV